MKRLLLLALIILSFPNAYSQERRTLTKENRFGKFTFSYIEVDGKVVYDGPCSYTEKFNSKAPDGTPSTYSQIVKGAYKNGNPDGQWVWTLNGKNSNRTLDDTYYYDFSIKMIRTLKDGEYDGLYSFEANIHERAGWYVGTTWRWVFDRKHNPYKESFIIKDGKVTGTSEGYTCKDNVVTKYRDKEYTNGFLNNTVVNNHVVRFTDAEIDSLMTFFAENPDRTYYIHLTDTKWFEFKREIDRGKFGFYSEYRETNHYSPMSSFWVDLTDEGFGLPSFSVDLQTIECVEVGSYETPDFEDLESSIRATVRQEEDRIENESYFWSYKYKPELKDSVLRFSRKIIDEEYELIDFKNGLHGFKKALNDTLRLTKELSWSNELGWVNKSVRAYAIPEFKKLKEVNKYLTLDEKEFPRFIKGFTDDVFKTYRKKADSLSNKAQLDSCVAEYYKVRSKNIALVRKYESDYNDLAQTIDSTIAIFGRIPEKYYISSGFLSFGLPTCFGEALLEIKRRFKSDHYDNNFSAEKAYYQLASEFILWYEVNYKKARRIKTVDELFAAAGITF